MEQSIRLFNMYILPILNYGCEVWMAQRGQSLQDVRERRTGMIEKEIEGEKVLLNMLRSVLGVRWNTSAELIWHITEQFPIRVNRIVKKVKFFVKVSQSKGFLKEAYECSKMLIYGGFASDVALLVGEMGMTNTFCVNNGLVGLKWVDARKMLKEKLMDGQHLLYSEILEKGGIRDTIRSVNIPCHRRALIRLVLGSQDLRVETSHYEKDENRKISERRCVMCVGGEVEDAQHFLLVCPSYNHLRVQLVDALKKKGWDSRSVDVASVLACIDSRIVASCVYSMMKER